MTYDTNNIFAKILRGEIPNTTVYEDDFVLAFYDISPARKVHALVIPKGAYTDYTDFIDNATADEIIGFHNGVIKTIDILGIREKGYRIISNTGQHGQQEVPHLHYHILGGECVGVLVMAKPA